jgi:hypothetical protein
MTRDEKIAEAKRRAALGDSPPMIAPDLGVATSTIYRWLYPDRYSESSPHRAAQKRAWENAMRAPCGRCGGPRRAGSLRADGTQRAIKTDTCDECRSEHRIELVLAMWRMRCDENLLNKDIAARLGIPVGTVATELCRLRALGFAVPTAAYNGADQRPARARALDASAVRLGAALRERGITPEQGLSAVAA